MKYKIEYKENIDSKTKEKVYRSNLNFSNQVEFFIKIQKNTENNFLELRIRNEYKETEFKQYVNSVSEGKEIAQSFDYKNRIVKQLKLHYRTQFLRFCIKNKISSKATGFNQETSAPYNKYEKQEEYPEEMNLFIKDFFKQIKDSDCIIKSKKQKDNTPEIKNLNDTSSLSF